MKLFKKINKVVTAMKVILVVFTVLATAAAAVAAVIFWKKKKDAEKLDAETIDNLIDEQLDEVEIAFEGEEIEE